MSLMRQVWLLVLGVVLLSLLGSVAVSTGSVRQVLQDQLRIKNSDNAASLALALSQQHGDASLMQLLISAQFDTGHYELLRWRKADGKVAFELKGPQGASQAPQWFQSMASIEAPAGLAQVSDGWNAAGSIEVMSQSAYAYDSLWSSTLRNGGFMVVLGLLAGGLALLVLRRIRRPLDNAVAQAKSMSEGTFALVEESRVPELQRLTQAMNVMVKRVKALFEAQAEQLRMLATQAHRDPLTGMATRKHFLAELDSALTRDEGPSRAGLVLVRLRDLAGLNQRLGRPQVDLVLTTIAHAVNVYPEHVNGCLAGRLNGADFALWLPAPDVAKETARALGDALRASLPAFGNGVQVAMGSIELPRERPMSTWLGEADAVLARAESQPGLVVEASSAAQDAELAVGERAWRTAVLDAVKARRGRLREFPVNDRHGALLHLECPLQLRLEEHAEFVPAARWLPLAVRSRLTAEADVLAVSLALEAIHADAKPRCVNIAPASLSDGAFTAKLRELIFARPQDARKLGLEVAETAAIQQFDQLQELGRQLRPLGVKLGLEHAGAGLVQIDRLYQLGLDYVKLDASVVTGVIGDAARAAFVRGTLVMLRSLNLKVYGEGLVDERDVLALWECDLDGVTGPWATAKLGR